MIGLPFKITCPEFTEGLKSSFEWEKVPRKEQFFYMNTVFVQEIYGGYQKAIKKLYFWALLFGLASITLDHFGMKASPGLALIGMVICIILAERCHWESIYFLKEQIDKERRSL